MCGIVGIVGHSPVNQQIYDALTVLQHRGQDAAGIMTCDDGELFMRKQNGLVRDVFQQRHMLRLKGNIGIGHVRYPTAGCDSSSEAQPFFVNSPYGICLGHNGNLTNAAGLAEVLIRRNHIAEAERIALEAVETVGEHDLSSRATTTMALGLVRAAQGRDEEAEALLLEALEVIESSGFLALESWVLSRLEQFLRERGRDEEAAVYGTRLAELAPVEGLAAAFSSRIERIA